MTETPERIWVREVPVKVVCHGEYDLTEENGGTPYVPASLLDEAVEALVAIDCGYGPNHLSKYARDTARATLVKIRSKTE